MEHIRVTAFIRHTQKWGVSPVNYYRAELPVMAMDRHDARFLNRVFTQTEVFEMIKNKTTEIIFGSNIYMISRIFRRRGLRGFLKALHDDGGYLIFDTDDDLTEDYRQLGGRGEEFKYTLEVVGQADMVTVSTPYLAKRLEQYLGHRPVVLPNHIDVPWFSRVSANTERSVPGLSIGLIGTISHYGDWHYPVEALVELAKEFEHVTIAAAGYMPDYLAELDNVVAINGVPYSKYPGMVRQFDIVCCSLDSDDEFNQSKSAIKALEAMASLRTLKNGKLGGAVAVCTDMPVYRRCVSNKHNGLLADNDNWYEPLRELITNEDLRLKLASAGYKWVKQHRNMETGYKRWSKAYRKFLEEAS